MGQLRKRDADMLLATRDMEKSRAEAVEREERRLRRMCRRGGVPFVRGREGKQRPEFSSRSFVGYRKHELPYRRRSYR